MKTIFQLYINGVPSKHVFNNEVDAITLKNRISIMYRRVEILSFKIPVKTI